MQVTNLRCEYLINPIGVDTPAPRFSWNLEHRERGQMQTAYQILVASRREFLTNDTGDIWDSGKVESDQSVNISYAGSTLTSRSLCYWKVRVWDSKQHISAYSPEAAFEMGLLRQEDWQGHWITWDGLSGPIFRKGFTLAQPVIRARLYISGAGCYEARLNGKKVGTQVLDPGWTDYEKTVLYSTFDVTDHLRQRENALGVLLGNGRYAPPGAVVKKSPFPLRQYGERPLFIAQLHLEYGGGTSAVIVSDTSWKAAAGPIVFNDIYVGEEYDARVEQPGWDAPGFDETSWQGAIQATAPGGTLVSQVPCPPITVSRTMLPKTMRTPQTGVFVYDFGQNFSGWVRLRVRGPRGAAVKIRHAELLHPDGMLNVTPNRHAEATDIYILKGEGEELFEPRFTYHGFRFVELTGFPGTPSLETLEGCVVHTAVPSTGNFLCANPVINQIHQNVLWGQRSNLMSIPTDCPQRDERMGWIGDAQLTVEEAVHNFDMAGFYTKWLRDMRDAQDTDGSIPDVVPMYWPTAYADPAWGTACLIIPWTVYQYYGDQRILETNYALMRAYVDHLTVLAQDDVLRYSKFGDWCPPWHIQSPDTPMELVSQWYYYHDTRLLARIAGILGNTGDAARYAEQGDRIQAAFTREFLHGSTYRAKRERWYQRLIPENLPEHVKNVQTHFLTKVFERGSQTSHVLALFLNLVPEEKRDAVLEQLIDDIVVEHGNHLNTGIVGTRYILDVLSSYGCTNLAYKLMTAVTYPSLGYMVKEGATTLWERWEYLTEEGMNSQNHIMLGSVDAWFYRFLAGIQIDPEAPGWRHFIIRPHVPDALEFADASIQTVRGLAAAHWRKGDQSLTLKVTIPVNSEATVSIPTCGLRHIEITESGQLLWKDGTRQQPIAGISGGIEEAQYVTVELGSGIYNFEVSGHPES